MHSKLRCHATPVIAAFLALLALAFSPVAITGAKDQEQKKLEALKNEISSLQKQLRRTNDERDDLAAQLRDTEIKAADIQKNLRKLNQQINSLNTELNTLKEQQEGLVLKKQQQAQLVGRELNAAYRLGRHEPLKLLFNLENPDNISRIMKYYEYMVEARSAILVNYKNTLDEIARNETTLLNKQALLKDDQLKFTVASSELEKELHERQGLLSKINEQRQSDSSRLKKLKLERGQLEKIIATLERNIRHLSIPSDTPFSKQKGKLPWPVKGRISYRFGATRNTTLKWTGWLIDAKEASPVKAVHHGRVVFSDYLRGHGLMLIIDHGRGYLSLYAHNQILLKETGDWVASGEDIARVGNTGGLTSSALYFEIRSQGKAIDPKRWLKPKAS